MPIEIRHRWEDRILYAATDAATMREAVMLALKRGADLSGADLSGADLSGADLRRAVLSGADLSGAVLRRAVLSGADLSDADLSGADLRRAVLSGADLSGAVLSGADLSGAVLRRAVLRRAVLSDADLSGIKDDLFVLLASVPHEIAGLREHFIAGKINGSVYDGECACLVGTVANIRHCRYDSMSDLRPDSSRPIERFALAVRPGDMPDTNPVARLIVEWIDEWLTAHPESVLIPA